jgi:hypothetical protein
LIEGNTIFSNLQRKEEEFVHKNKLVGRRDFGKAISSIIFLEERCLGKKIRKFSSLGD